MVDLNKVPRIDIVVPDHVRVEDLGENGDAWFVTGTNDLAIGQEAVKQHLRKTFTGKELRSHIQKFNETNYTTGLDYYWVHLPNGDDCLLKVSLNGERGLGLAFAY